jgi:hypothetical protein
VTALLAAARTPLPRLAAAGAAALLTLLTWHVSSLIAEAGVDPSWRVALHLAHARGIGFGPSFVWTYGPLGYLCFPLAVTGPTLAAALAFVLATQTALAYVLIRRAGAVVGGGPGVLASYVVLMLPIQPADFLSLVVLALSLWALAEPSGAAARLLPPVGGVLAAAAVLTKTNLGVAAVGVLLVAALAGGARRLAEAAAVVAVSFCVLWVSFGNALADIPGWWRLSASLVGGYSAAMQTERPGLGSDHVWAAVLTVVLAALTAAVVHARGRRYGTATAVVIAGYAFATFKESFVRHDATHAPAFFAAAAVVFVSIGPRGRARVLAAAGLTVAVVALAASGQLSVRPWSSAGLLAAHLRDTVDSGRRTALVAESRVGQRRSYEVPTAILRRLRGHTVHVEPWEAAAISAYELTWRPLPVPQAYSAYTSELDERNAAFLASARAPERILREDPTEHVNGRSPELDDPATGRAILCNYRQLATGSRWQVLARQHPRCGRARVLVGFSIASGQTVPVPEAGQDDLVIARIRLSDPLVNRLRGLLYKPHDAALSLAGGPFTPVAADVLRDGLVLHVPGNVGYDPRFGGAIDWRTIAVAGLGGHASIAFEAMRVRGRGPAPAGERPPRPLPQDVLEKVPGGERVVTAEGQSLTVEQGGGFVDYAYVRGGSLVLQGWAADVATGAPARSILVFAAGRLVFAGPPNVARPDVAASLGKPSLRGAGYALLVPVARVRGDGVRRAVRIFSIVGSRALEVQYPLSYGWR